MYFIYNYDTEQQIIYLFFLSRIIFAGGDGGGGTANKACETDGFCGELSGGNGENNDYAG
jgi:hypothetical protein